MEFDYRDYGSSQVSDSNRETQMSFAPDTLREPAFFVGKLVKHLPFREAISALPSVVVSDQRYQPKHRTEYLTWAEQNELNLLAEFMGQSTEISAKALAARQEFDELRKQDSKILATYYRAQANYFRYLHTHDMDDWMVLDPVITVHPD